MRPPPLLLVLLFCLAPSPALGAPYIDYNGFRYQLANPAANADLTDLTGDDCAATPCPSFAVPSTCSATYSTTDLASVAQLNGWSTSFLAAADNVLYPVNDWLTSPGTVAIVSTTSGQTQLAESGWSARIVLRCRIPCAAGSVVTATLGCTPCEVGKWSVEGGTACQACTNAPPASAYTSSGAGGNNCSYACNANTYALSAPSPFLVASESGGALRMVGGDGSSAVVYTPRMSDLTYGANFIAGSTLNPAWVYCGSTSVNRVDLRTGAFTTIAGTAWRGFADGTGNAAGFSFISAAGPWKSEAFLLVLDAVNCNLRQVDLSSRAVTTVLGNLVCGFRNGLGTNAAFMNPSDMVVTSDGAWAYIADTANYRIRKVDLGTMNALTLVGNGAANSNLDGVGTAATVDPRYLALSPDQTTLYVRCITSQSLRRVALSTGRITTLSTIPGGNGLALASSAVNPNVLYLISGNSINLLLITSGQTSPIAQNLFSPSRLFVLNETAAAKPLCAACAVCPVGAYGACNASACLPCPAGTYTSTAGLTACVQCPLRTFGADGQCVTCPAGTYTSTTGNTGCVSCEPGTFGAVPGSDCSNCSTGTYSAGFGNTSCAPCANAIGNATLVGPGTNATNCPFACRPGFTYAAAANTCSQCLVGQWSAAGSTLCSSCAPAPVNATLTGVGTSATNCPFVCNAGYVLNTSTSSCTPCTAGTRQSGTACVACTPGSYSDPAASVCTVCGSGRYSTGAASACARCAHQGPYTGFLGRGTSVNCPFYCTAGAYIVNKALCVPCANGTFATAAGATRCANCPLGMWSVGASSVCTVCSALNVVAANGTGLLDYPDLAKAGWGVVSVVCVP